MEDAHALRRAERSTSTPGATRTAACPPVPPRPRWPATLETLAARRHAHLRGGPRAADRAARGRRPGTPLRRSAHQRLHHRLPGPPARPIPLDRRAPGHAHHLGRRRRAAVPALHLLDHRRRARLAGRSPASASRAATSCPPTTASGSPRESLATVPPAPPAPPGRRLQLRNASCPPPLPRPRFYPRPRPVAADLQRPLDGSAAALGCRVPRTGPRRRDAADHPEQRRREHLVPRTGSALQRRQRTRVFVAEIERDGSAFLRFGDDQHGVAPTPALAFTATYRVGNGTAGQHRPRRARARRPARPALRRPARRHRPRCATRSPRIGGIDPENMDHIRQYAPFALRDPAALRHRSRLRAAWPRSCPASARPAARCAGPAAGTRRSSRSIRSPPLTTPLVDGHDQPASNLLRMMGTDLAVEGAVIVGLRIEMEICVDPDALPGRRLPGADAGLHHRRSVRRPAAAC